MKAEKLLKGKGMEVDLIPVPREISSDCRVTIELPLGLREDVIHLFKENKISILECYIKAGGREFAEIE
jgi:hypothetical protein